MISIKDLAVGYTKPILQSVNIDIKKGELVGILGPNGCGKTTLVRALTRSLNPIRGCVKINGTDIKDFTARDFAKKVALVEQNVWCAFDYTVLEVVLMGRYPHLRRFEIEGEKDNDIAIEAIKQVGLENMLSRPVTTLSGGERQRVIIAKAIAQQADILVLDEPTSQLDINHAIEIMNLARNVNNTTTTTIAVMHDINLAAKYCSRIILLADGEVFADGNTHQVVTSENIKAVFSADVTVCVNPIDDRPFVMY